MAKVKHDHAVTQMALSNLDAWVNSPRVLSMIVCIVVYCVMQGVVDQGGFWVAGIELQLTLPEKLFVKLYNRSFSSQYVVASVEQQQVQVVCAITLHP